MSQNMKQILEMQDLVLLVALLLCTSVGKAVLVKSLRREHKKLCLSMMKLLGILG